MARDPYHAPRFALSALSAGNLRDGLCPENFRQILNFLDIINPLQREIFIGCTSIKNRKYSDLHQTSKTEQKGGAIFLKNGA